MAAPVRVLHVDDEPGFAELVATFLEEEDDAFEVVTETDARDALDRLRAEGDAVDCVVSDYDMPGLDGVEFLEAVREDYPDVPFVLFTGKGSEEVASDALSAGATDYLQKGDGTEQYAILANRVRNAVEQYRSERRAADVERLRNLAAKANRELVRAASRRDVERRVVEAVSGAPPYRFAWIGEVDEDADRIRPRVSADDDGYLDDVVVTVTGDDAGQGPAGRAVEQEEVAVSQDVAADPAFDPWREQVSERGVRSAAAAPLVYEDECYGVLVVYATEPGAFDDAEQALLDELAADVAHAIHAREVRDDLALHNRAMNEAPVGITITDPSLEDNPVVFANDAFTELTGYERADIVGENHRILQGPDSDPDAVAAMREAVDEGEPVTVELWNYRKDGSRFWNRVSIAPVREDGEVVNFVGFQEDVTERKRRERELRESQHRFEALFDDPNILVGLLDPDGTLRDANQTALSYLDADREDVVGEPFWETPWWSAEARDDLQAWISRAADGEYVEYETEHEQSGNGAFVVEGAIRPVTDESGDVQSLVVSARDVTDRERRERVLERQNERFDELA
ncbi:MAG: PAS domain S-box protein, partial [Halobacterium sp.]